MVSVHIKKNYRLIILLIATVLFGLIVSLPNPEGLTDNGKKALAMLREFKKMGHKEYIERELGV